jgi:outer membrane protein OmpA-like peptidoglycan-associated protein
MQNTIHRFQRHMTLLLMLLAPLSILKAQSDKENCAEHPMIPSRIPGYYIGNCEVNDFSSHVVLTAQGEKTVEGKKTVLEYFLSEGGKGVSETYVRRNYMEAIRKQGARIEYELNGRGVGSLRQADGTTYWVDVAGYVGDGSPEETGHFYLTIVEIAAMEQVITPESDAVITQMAGYLNANKGVNVYIVGHTDSEGSAELNMQLSEQRAQAVVNALVTRHKVAPVQLTTKGVGPLSPVASNASEAGRKLNRRVEMVLK